MNHRLLYEHQRLANGVTKAVGTWIGCVSCMTFYPSKSWCPQCSPPDPPDPLVGMPVRTIYGDTTIHATNSLVIYTKDGRVCSVMSWCDDVQPDFSRWAAYLGNRPVINPVLDVSSCSACSSPHPYPEDSEPNCDKGWECGMCRTLKKLW